MIVQVSIVSRNKSDKTSKFGFNSDPSDRESCQSDVLADVSCVLESVRPKARRVQSVKRASMTRNPRKPCSRALGISGKPKVDTEINISF
jgi:hypothetical protein